MKDVAQTGELNDNQRSLVATFLPLLPVISPLEKGGNQENITNCFTAQNCTDLSGTSIKADILEGTERRRESLPISTLG
jgi:hypothetical protein